MDPSVKKTPESALPEMLVTPVISNAETRLFKDARVDPESRGDGDDWGCHSRALSALAVHQQTHALPARANLLHSTANAKIIIKQQSTIEGSRLVGKSQKDLAGVPKRRVQERLTARAPRHRDWKAQACSQAEYQAWKRLGQKRLIDAYDWEDNVVVLLQGQEMDGEGPEQEGLEIFQ
ncbi:MAG: hypothetical protein Q9184_006571 [Pyrenodesmia sp. 2 TL-2023]